MSCEYLLVLLLVVVFPVARSGDRRLRLYDSPSRLTAAIVIPSLLFWTWDLVGVMRGHWWFNQQMTLGVRFLLLPVEEWLFFPVIAFVAIFTWESLKVLTNEP
jgi:lycopene beta-cyclase